MSSKKYKTIDVMIDAETIGLCDNTVITQLAAVAFILEDETVLLDTFDECIGVRSCIESGLKIDGPTVEWWFKQPVNTFNNVLLKAIQSDVTLASVLNKFSSWIRELKTVYGLLDYKTSINIWGNGALADNKWLRQAYKVCNIDVPWHFTEDRDVRTLVELGSRFVDYEYKKVVFEGTVHNALDDCKHQIKYCCEIYKKIKNLKNL
jgi:hypothetical protein